MPSTQKANLGFCCCLGWYPTVGIVIGVGALLVWAFSDQPLGNGRPSQMNGFAQKQVVQAVVVEKTKVVPPQLGVQEPVVQQPSLQPAEVQSANDQQPRDTSSEQVADAPEPTADSKATPAAVGKEPVFVFNRLSKTGGSVLERVLRKSVPNIIVVNEADTLLVGLEKVPEGDPTFVLGSRRDPCSMILSHWSMNSDEVLKYNCYNTTTYESRLQKTACGSAMYHCVRREFCGVDEQSGFLGDVDRFRAWVRLPETTSLASKRLARKYNKEAALALFKRWSDNTPAKSFTLDREPDCWVETDFIFDQLPDCLRKFEARGGVVAWDKFNADTKLIKERKAVNTGVYKKVPNLCQRFFDADTEAFMREHDAGYFAATGYRGCCTHETDSR